MKTFIKANREIVEQVGISQYLFNFDFDIPQVGLECKAELTFEPKKFINNLYEYLLRTAEERLKLEQMLYVKQDGTQAQISPSMLSSLCMNLVTQAMQDVTDDGKNLMTIIIKERKEVLKEYREKSKDEIKALEEHVKNNDKKLEELKKKIEIQDEEGNKLSSKHSSLNAEKSSQPRSDTQVVSTATQENQGSLERAVQQKRKPRPQDDDFKPKKSSLRGLI